MALRVQPNVERLVMDHLRDIEELDQLVDGRVWTAFDAKRGFPQVVITRIPASGADQYNHLDRARLQIDVWGAPGSRPLVHEVMQTVRAAMSNDQIAGEHDLGVVNKTEEVSMGYLPESLETGGPARPRYILDIRLWLHP